METGVGGSLPVYLSVYLSKQYIMCLIIAWPGAVTMSFFLLVTPLNLTRKHELTKQDSKCVVNLVLNIDFVVLDRVRLAVPPLLQSICSAKVSSAQL